AAPSTITYTPLSASTAQVTRAEGGPTLNVKGFNNADGNLTLNKAGSVLAVNLVASTANDAVSVTHLAAGGTRLVDRVNGTIKWVPLDVGTTSVLNSLAVHAGLGNDTVTVDSTSGPVALAGGLSVDGGSGSNLLVLTGAAALTDAYTPGAGTGSDVQTYAGNLTQQVSFANVAAVIDVVTG